MATDKNRAKDGESLEDEVIEVRMFKSKDYQSVFEMVKDAKFHPWEHAYWRTFNGSKAYLLFIRGLVISLAYGVDFGERDNAWRLSIVLMTEVAIVGAVTAVFLFDSWIFLYDEVYDFDLKNWTIVLVATTRPRSGVLSTINSSISNNCNSQTESTDDQGKVVAAVALQKEEEEEGSEKNNNWRVGFIVALDDYKEKGLAKHLCQDAMSRAALGKPGKKTTFNAVVPDSSEMELPILVDQLGFTCINKVKDKNRKWWKTLVYAFNGVEWLELVKTI